jgi:predicted transcriptional regulator
MASKIKKERGILVAAKLEPEIYERLKRRAKAEDRSKSAVVRRAIGQYLMEREAEPNGDSESPTTERV